MTSIDRFDDVVAQWLLESGPADIRASAVSEAVDRAGRLPQHRGIRARLLARPTLRPRARTALAAVLVVLALAVTVIAAGMLLSQPPNPLLGGGGWINASSSSTDIHILAADGAPGRSFTRGHGSCPKLSPDGTEVAYKIRFQGLYATRLADEAHRGVASGQATSNFGYREGVWSPDRAYLSFRTTIPNGQAVNVVTVFGNERPVRTIFSTTTNEILTEAAWSADSKLVAIAHGRASDFRVAVMDLDGVVRATHGPFAIDPGAAGLLSLAWSPEGARLLYQAANGGSPAVRIIDLASGTLDEAVMVGSGDYAAASPWSPDGRWLALGGADGNLLMASIDGTTQITGPALFVEPGGYIPRWSPAANVVAVMTPTGLVTVAAEGGSRTELRAIPDGVRWGFAWSPDGSRIVVAEDDGASGGLRVTNLDATGRSAPVSLGTFPSIGESELCVSWDGPTNE